MFLSLYSLYWLRWKRRLDTLSVLAYEKTYSMEKSQDDMVRKRSHLSAEEKYQILLQSAMAKGNGSISKIMRC
jgi:hypothetical protein